jgi:3-oxoadipate CoA-transferase, alpha subunit
MARAVIDKRVGSVDEAVADVGDGATVMVGGFGGSGHPKYLVQALRRKGSKDLTLVANTAGAADRGVGVLVANRQVKKVICSFPIPRVARTGLDTFWELVEQGRLEVEIVPQGTLAERIRAGGAGIPAFYTPVGVGTLLGEGKEVRRLDGRDCVLESALVADFAFLRAARADRAGNLVYRRAQRSFNVVMAMAARTSVAEVYASVETGQIDPEDVVTPGIFVDRTVVVPDDRLTRSAEATG